MYKTLTKNVTFKSVIILSAVLFMCLSAFSAVASTITTLTVKEMDGVSTSNYPLTFGHVFKEGDVTGNVYLNNYPTQTDVKSTYGDGSIRFAVISALVQMTANSDTILNINTTGTAASTTPMTKTEILATDIGATIDLTGLSGCGYSGNLQADLRAAITAETTLDYWLEGGIVSEILVNNDLNNSLNATWEARFYQGTSYVRISHAIENVESNYRGNVNYAVDIKQGNAVPTLVYTKADFQHNLNSRWRKVYWLGTAPPEVEVHYGIDYLISTKAVMNYDTSLVIPEDTIFDTYSTWESSDHDIMGNGLLKVYFPTTGGRQEIGILPTWTVRYLLSMDNRMKKIMLNSAEMSSSCPIHYRESDVTKSFYGKVVSIDDRPTVWTSISKSTSFGHSEDNLPAYIGDTTNEWKVDMSHQGSFAYLPYIITGEKYFYDEMVYWAAWDLSASSYAADNIYGRDYANGLLNGQVRAQAWGIRNIVDAAVFTLDGSTVKTYFMEKVSNNITAWETDIQRHALRFWDVDIDSKNRVSSVLDKDTVYRISAGWMNDFMVIVLQHTEDLGIDVTDIMSEFSTFTINRFTNPSFNAFNGAMYQFPVEYFDNSIVGTWSDASDLYVSQPTVFSSDSDKYQRIALSALSTLIEYPNGRVAYDWLSANIFPDDNLNADPTWAIIPLSPKPPLILQIIH